MSALSHIDSLATQATRFSGDSGDELSLVLLVVSSVAMIASGIGLIFLCARALLRRGKPPTQPWITQALISPTIHTRKYVEELAKVPIPPTVREPQAEPPPVSEREPVTLRRPTPAAPHAPHATHATVAEVVAAEAASPASELGPASTDPTLEMDLGAFAISTSLGDDLPPPESIPPSEPTAVREPFLLLAKKPGAVQQFEIPPPPALPSELAASSDGEPEPMKVHRSGTVPRANPAEYMRTLASYSDGARRA